MCNDLFLSMDIFKITTQVRTLTSREEKRCFMVFCVQNVSGACFGGVGWDDDAAPAYLLGGVGLS